MDLLHRNIEEDAVVFQPRKYQHAMRLFHFWNGSECTNGVKIMAHISIQRMEKPSPSLKVMDEDMVEESPSRKRKRRRSPQAESIDVEMAVSDTEGLKSVGHAKDAKLCDEADIIPQPTPRSSVNSFLDLSWS
jgi:hypothetical protein